MRLGIRAQLLCAVGGLLVLAFAPLFLAVTSLTHAGLAQRGERHARELGRSTAGHVAEARRSRPPAELGGLLEAQLGYAVGAICLYDRAGRPQRQVGEPDAVAALPPQVPTDREQAIAVRTARGSATVVVVPSEGGPVAVLLRADAATAGTGPLIRLAALYTALLGVVLLVFSYFVLTRIVVRPVTQLSDAARRVAEGARRLAVPRAGARELCELGTSLATMTERLRAEEAELRQKVAELETATAELARAQDGLVRSARLASVGRLAAGLAHEIGNPIAALLSMQQLMLDGDLEPGEQRDFLERMKRETERISRVLRDLLDFARPAARTGAGGGEPDGPPAVVGEVVEHVLALCKPQKAFADIELITAFDLQLPAVGMPPERLEQVLLNLLLNAADAVPKPGGIVTIQASATPEGVRVAVEDNGSGIDASVKERLFEPFVTTKDVGKGTGLGLAVCRGLVESAGGAIRAEDGAQGARFVFELPRAEGEDADRGGEIPDRDGPEA
ncbi:MAG: HAMP domain-containing histidine kinase [Deltaproteobacteria bacterium]|nr:HAMP domain-containing histidine kinase [Deltaproteobacteria bacterium]